VSWTKSQIVAVISGVAVALLLALIAGGWLAFRSQRFGAEAKLTPLHFDGSNLVKIDNDSQLQFGTGPFAISFWIRTTTPPKNQTLISKRVSTMGNGWVISALEDNRFLLYTAGCASPASSPQAFRDGKWHHVAFVREGQTVTIFFDNNAVGTGPDICDHNDSNPISVGMDAQKSWAFEGDIAELHLYGRALNTVEIAEEWNNGQGRQAAASGGGLLAGFHFDDRGGTAAADFSGNSHSGTLTRSSAEPAPN